MSLLQHATVEDFSREVLISSVPIVVDVDADWCGPCRALAPVLERLGDLYAKRLKFVKVNADEEREIVRHYQVEGLPTLLLFNGGQLVDRPVQVNSTKAPSGLIREASLDHGK